MLSCQIQAQLRSLRVSGRSIVDKIKKVVRHKNRNCWSCNHQEKSSNVKQVVGYLYTPSQVIEFGFVDNEHLAT